LVGDHNTVIGNLIGTDRTGTVALGGSVSAGVEISGSANTVGAPGAGNLISGHGWKAFGAFQVGVRLSGGQGNVVRSNRIGSDISGALPLPNVRGVDIAMYSFADLARNSRIGGTGPGEGNVIAYNLADGVAVNGSAGVGATGVNVSRNSIFANGELGINLISGFIGYPATVTLNDLGDADAGPNNLQNFPVLLAAVDNGASTTVTGTVDMASPTLATIEIYANDTPDPSGFGEGQTFVGSTTPSAAGSFVASLPSGLAGKVVTAVATDAAGNSSEFCSGIAVVSQTTSVGPTRHVPRIDVCPNPAQAEARVRLSLTGAEVASVVVFDLRGRVVRTLAERRLFEPGLHELRWHGDDERGTSVPPGVYFLRLTGESGSEVLKLLLTR
jgi:hypothetical protein